MTTRCCMEHLLTATVCLVPGRSTGWHPGPTHQGYHNLAQRPGSFFLQQCDRNSDKQTSVSVTELVRSQKGLLNTCLPLLAAAASPCIAAAPAVGRSSQGDWVPLTSVARTTDGLAPLLMSLTNRFCIFRCGLMLSPPMVMQLGTLHTTVVGHRTAAQTREYRG